MTRFFYRTYYLLIRGWRGFRASARTAVVTMITIAIALLMVGAFALLIRNMQHVLLRFGEELRVTAYLEDSADINELRQLAATVEGVEQVRVISKEEALIRFREQLGEQSDLLDGIDENPLPASLEIQLRRSQRSVLGMEVVIQSLDGLEGISELHYGRDWVEGYGRAVALMRSFALSLAAVLGFAALVICANTIRLAVYARREEIAILQLVGANRSFIRIPLLLEGCLQGLIGAGIALLLLFSLYHFFQPGLRRGLSLLLGHGELQFLQIHEAAFLLLIGVALGATGALLAFLWEKPA